MTYFSGPWTSWRSLRRSFCWMNSFATAVMSTCARTSWCMWRHVKSLKGYSGVILIHGLTLIWIPDVFMVSGNMLNCACRLLKWNSRVVRLCETPPAALTCTVALGSLAWSWRRAASVVHCIHSSRMMCVLRWTQKLALPWLHQNLLDFLTGFFDYCRK